MLSLLATLLLAGSALAAPVAEGSANAGGASCGSRSSQTKAWTVADFDFHASYVFTTPAHQNSWGYVNFTLANPAVDYTARCSAQSNQLQDFFYGNFVYNCEVPAGAGPATFAFARPGNALSINQTWSCPDEGSRYEAKGGAALTLACDDKTWENPDWQPGAIYSTRTIECQHVTTQVPITEMSAVA